MDLAESDISIDRSLRKGEVPRFLVGVTHFHSYERLLKFSCHPEKPLGIDKIIATSDINIRSAVFRSKWA